MYHFLSILLNCKIYNSSDTKNAKSTTEFKKKQIQEQRLTKVIMHNDVDGVFTRGKSLNHMLLKIRIYFSLFFCDFSNQLLLANV